MQKARAIRILILSRDVSLVSSRTNLLTLAGYSAEFEPDHERALRRVRSRRFHLVVLSNSFTRDEQLGLRAKLILGRPGLPVLLLSNEQDSADSFLASVEATLRSREHATNPSEDGPNPPRRPKA